jgi:EmrB/QacA subfamily drug resistance transporter
MGSAVNLALPHMAEEYGLNTLGQGWVVTVYLLVAAILQVPMARVADIVGKKRIFILGLLIFSTSSLCCGLIPGGAALITFRGLQGLGSAMVFSTAMAIISIAFPSQERGKAIGINTAVVYLSAALGPSLGGLLTHNIGWRSVFFITAAIALASGVGSMKALKSNWIESKGESFDLYGSLIYAVSIFSLIYGFSNLPSVLGFSLVALGSITFLLFILFERRRQFPVFDVKLFFSNKVFRLSSFAALINYAATYAVGFMLSLYLQRIKEYNAQEAGLILIAQPAIQALLSPLTGRLSDKIEARYLASMGMGLIALVLLFMCFITVDTSFIIIAVMLFLLGVGFAFFSSPNANAIMGSVDKKHYSLASATTGTMRLTGQAFSMGIAMMVISIFLQDKLVGTELSVEFLKAMRVAFLIFSLLCAVGVYASMIRGKMSTSDDK